MNRGKIRPITTLVGTLGAVTFRDVDVLERWREIQDLRRLSYFGDGIQGAPDLSSDVPDPRDLSGNMIAAESRGRIIGLIRVTAPLPGPLFHPKCRLIGDLAAELPPRHQIVEGSSGCIHPDRRGQGLFWHLAAHLFLRSHQIGGDFVVCGSSHQISAFWYRCGFRKTKLHYRGVFSGERYSVLLADLSSILAGEGIVKELRDVILPLAGQTLPFQQVS